MSTPVDRRGPRGARRPEHHHGRAREDGRTSSFWSGYDLLWGLTPPPAQQRRGGALDRARIVQAAVAIADDEGLDAVTMRRVAQALHTGAMSLYRHVPDKDALVSLMIDSILGEHDRGQLRAAGHAARTWRAKLRLVAESTWRLCRAHRWYPEASLVRPPLTPNALAGLEWAFSIFDDYDLPAATKMQFVGTVHSCVLNAALSTAIDERTRARFGMTEHDAMAASWPFMRRMIDSGEYPRVVDYMLSAPHLDDEQQLLAGVELIMDGIESRLAGAPPKRGRKDRR